MAGCYLLLNLTKKSEIFGDREDNSPMVTYSDQQFLQKFRMNKSKNFRYLRNRKKR